MVDAMHMNLKSQHQLLCKMHSSVFLFLLLVVIIIIIIIIIIIQSSDKKHFFSEIKQPNPVGFGVLVGFGLFGFFRFFI